jgi:type IV pilus assembly protein PilV
MSLKSRRIFLLASRQRGFTLIEILVTVVVLAIGLLGLAGLQATSLRFNNSAYHRSQATSLACDMADRMRVNRQAALGGAYDGQACNDPPLACAVVAPAGDLDQQDLEAWCNALTCTLPLGTGSITRNGDVFTINVRWNDSRDPDDDPLDFVMDTEL